jgi:cytochrome c peroxidase
MRTRSALIALAFALASSLACHADTTDSQGQPPPVTLPPHPLPNNLPIANGTGAAATFSDEGFVDRNDEFHTPQGTNGRSCATCHAPEAGWSITPPLIKGRFLATGGLHPLFNKLDANSPTLDLSTVMKRKMGYSLLLQGLFRRGGAVRPERNFDVVAVDDPNGVGSATVFSFYRRPLTTANMQLLAGVGWEGRFSFADDIRPPRRGLFEQARGNILGAQERPRDQPPSDALVNAIVDEELQIWHAQIAVPTVGRLDSCGGRGGPEWLSLESRRIGRFDLFDAWIGFLPGKCDRRPFAAALRAQIARGQEIFNTRPNDRGGTCLGCHNVANNGTSFDDRFFDIGVSDASLHSPELPLYTVRRRCPDANVSCEIEDKQTTDPGRAFVTGQFDDLSKFKVPTLRGAAARAPYFHNGSARTLRDVVRHYSERRGFGFTRQEEDDLVAFLNAL